MFSDNCDRVFAAYSTLQSAYGDSCPDAKTQFLQACAVKTVGRANIACDEQGNLIRRTSVTIVLRISSPCKGELPSIARRRGYLKKTCSLTFVKPQVFIFYSILSVLLCRQLLYHRLQLSNLSALLSHSLIQRCNLLILSHYGFHQSSLRGRRFARTV